ncbi:MAG: T9SS type A sorting domain-containing protein, partial [Bacteroidales bacterium]|nr:T9SS type A sorting domain-containing protein [Bacteroidales bacterium]
DVKKITENIDRIKTGDYDLFAPETFWHVESYETGSTEQGSSGSPLFNQDNQIIGVLTTGGLSCTPKINDLYQKMYHGWNDYSANNKRLDVWLDPRNDNVGYLNHFDPLVNYRESAKVYSNLDSLGIFIEGVESNGWGYTSGHSHMRGTKFAEKFSNKGTKYIDAIRMNPLRVSSNFDSSYVNLTIWENSLSDDKILFTQKIYLFELEEDDNQLLPLRDIIKVNNDFYIGYEIFYSTGDTFAVNMMETEENTALVYSNGNWDKLSYEGQSINGALAIEAIVFDYYPDMNDLKKVDKMEPITIYPVPANDHVQVFIKDKGSSDLRLEVINSSGTVVINNSYTGIDNNILVPINQIPHGLYIVRVFYEGKNGISKFVKY